MAKDYERLPPTSENLVFEVMIRLMLKRLAKSWLWREFGESRYCYSNIEIMGTRRKHQKYSPWVEAMITLANDPLADVVCPTCQQHHLIMFNHEVDPQGIMVESIVICPGCRAHNVMRKKHKPLEDGLIPSFPRNTTMAEMLQQLGIAEPIQRS